MYKTDKNTRILKLYYNLITGRTVSKNLFCVENGITGRSFDRDIEDIRLFLSEEQSYCELLYDRKDNVYYLSNILGKSLAAEISFLMVDILFYMRTFSMDEMDGIISALLDVTEIYKKDSLYDYVLEKAKLKKGWGDTAVLKMHRDLQNAIREHNIIELIYKVDEDKTVLRKVHPIQLKVDNGYIYLIAYITDKEYKNPAFYRLDRIDSFKVLCDRFSQKVQMDYLDRTKENDLYNMIAGEEISVTLKVDKSMKRILCDVFQGCTFVRSEEDYYIYNIKTYKQGFMNWIMGQEKGVVVLKPKNIRKEIIERLKTNLLLYEKEMM